MKRNVGGLDSIIRIIVAIIIGVMYFTNFITGTLGIVLLVLAGIFVVTGFVRFCPLYLPFRINTNK
ncbi:MAG TPA: DUF2892 domain-containing protein [Chitinophagales bacterium]|nr:DUF2892 domain-containing protein [Chitinophagales bacterium]